MSALDLDPSGSRLITGGYDYAVKYWDFHGMDTSYKPFRSQEPCGAYSIKDLRFNHSGDRFLIAPSSAQAKLYDRDGRPLSEFMKGDHYLLDMRNTKGHTSTLNGCDWHPKQHELFLTCSTDSTFRIWHCEEPKQQKLVAFVKSKMQGSKCSVSSAKFSSDGQNVFTGSEDGTIKMWPSNGPFHRPVAEVEKAHQSSTSIHLTVASTRSLLLSRSTDHTLKVWDIRKLNQKSNPVHVFSELPNDYPEARAIFSPDESFLVTGTSCKSKEQQYGRIIMFKTDTFESVYDTPLPSASVVGLTWHPKLNQIIIGKNDGSVSILYHPEYSHKGALLCVVRKASRREFAFIDATQ